MPAARKIAMKPTSIARLNAAARAIERTGVDGHIATREAAVNAGLTEIESTDDSALFRTARGRYVRAWYTDHRVTPAGFAGFDDQI